MIVESNGRAGRKASLFEGIQLFLLLMSTQKFDTINSITHLSQNAEAYGTKKIST